jgi:selenocysteine lyase/cysteine desulfurase
VTDLAATADLRDLVRELRDSEFPWTAATTYLNNASIGPIPERTRLALEAFNAKRTAPHLLPDRDNFAEIRAAREHAARLIGASPEEIALMPNTSMGVNVAARALPLPRGAVVLVSDREFPANVYPWLALRDEGIRTELAPVTAQGWPDEDWMIERLADPDVRVLAISLVQFSNGFRADLPRLSAACRAHGAYLVVDAIQGLGASPLDVRETPIDVLASGGQKWLLAPWGSGFVYVRRDLIGAMEPSYVGWMSYEGTDDFTNLVNYADRLLPDARRFEIGTHTLQDQLGMRHSLGLILELGVEHIARYTQALAQPLLAWCDAHEIRVTSPRDAVHRSSIVCVAPPNAAELHRQLKRAGVICALREGAIRLSPHCYNTADEIARVIDVLDEATR